MEERTESYNMHYIYGYTGKGWQYLEQASVFTGEVIERDK
jgi:hypothetical protein